MVLPKVYRDTKKVLIAFLNTPLGRPSESPARAIRSILVVKLACPLGHPTPFSFLLAFIFSLFLEVLSFRETFLADTPLPWVSLFIFEFLFPLFVLG